jgi:effector-binding domain-containing protein
MRGGRSDHDGGAGIPACPVERRQECLRHRFSGKTRKHNKAESPVTLRDGRKEITTKRIDIVLASTLLIAFVSVSVGVYCAEPAKDPGFSIRKVDEQVVLYTLYRGPYDKVGPAIGKLFQLAGEKGLIPKGPLCMSFLNNPELTEKEHFLSEIRIPVEKDALKLAGTLGEFTDVKVIKAHDAVVVPKREGQADPSSIYSALENWLIKQGYVGLEGPYERYLDAMPKATYAEMKTEMLIPVRKVTP